MKKNIHHHINHRTGSVWLYDKYGGLTVQAFMPCNIYGPVEFGKNVKIGAFTEISGHVVIGDNVTIGAHCFIPEGVIIKDNVWIGPRVTFTNDRFPPASKDKWEKTIVDDGARLGAAVSVVCGVYIGKNVLVGAGAVICKDLPKDEIYAGVPAKPIKKQKEE